MFNTFHFIANHPLTKDHKLTAMMRWFKWQIGSRLVPGPVAVPFVNETRLLAKPGMTGATGNIYCGLHEFEDMGFVLHFLRQGDIFVDVGANIGSYTILASATGADIISFEPVPETFEALLDNIALNHINGQVDARNQALGAKAGMLEMMADQDTTNQVILDDEGYSGKSVQIPVTTLDSVLQGRVPKLIKIDVEGFESEVLAGAKSVLSSPDLKAVIMELNGSGDRYGFDEESLHKKMLSEGFKSTTYNPINRRLIDLLGERYMTGNTLYIRDLNVVQKIVRQSEKYNILEVDL